MQNLLIEKNKLEAVLNLKKIASNHKFHHHLNKDLLWVKEFLLELCENATTYDQEYYLERSQLDIQVILEKKTDHGFGEVLLVDFKLKTLFHTRCIKSLEEMTDTIEHELKTCFIDAQFAESSDYAEETEIFLLGSMRELYFYENNKVPLGEMIHEQIFLNLNQRPMLEDQHSESPLKNAIANKKDQLH
jgi:uncharacterized metal-binding protein YceD (DUF177 family)